MIDYTGQQFGNHYLIRLLVHGNFTDVYLGEHVYLKKKTAVKILSMRLVGSNMENFLGEARTISNLKHPQILRLLDFGVLNTIPFLVMDYMPNGTLRQCYAPGSKLPITSIVSYVKDIAEALQHAHDEGIVHRDVKPENMFVGYDNSILLADFRIALTSQRLRYRADQRTASAVTYMAPEQITGNPCPASDQYALAAVVYEWVSGGPLFHGSFTEICDQQLHAPPPSLCKKMPELSPAVDEVIQRALAKNADKRFGRVREFANALEEAVLLELPTSPRELETLPAIDVPPFPEPQTAPMPLLSPLEEETDPTELPTLPGAMFTSLPFDIPPPSEPATMPMQTLASSTSPDPHTSVQVLLPDDAQLSQSRAKNRHHVSRRAFLAGLAGISLVGGTLAWLVTSQKQQKPPIPMGAHLFTYRGHHAYIASVTWSPDGKRIASGSGDKTVQVWTPTSGESVLTYRGHTDVLYTVAWSSDGKRIASGGADQTVQVWIAGGNGAIAGANHILTHTGHASTVFAVAWSPDSKDLASANNDGTVQVWSSTNGNTLLTYKGHKGAVWDAAWSPDGKRIASASFDRTVQVWNATDGSHALVYDGHIDDVLTAAWSPDGKRIASGGADKAVRLWDATTGVLAFAYRGHTDTVYHVAWSPDGTTIASASADSTVQVWDAATGGRIFTYRGHTGYVFTLAWSPDGQQIASGGADMTVQVWQAP
jgi:WD40 repeat protein